jgi:hypothetical protein
MLLAMANTPITYLSDVTDAEWEQLEPLVASTTRRGRPRYHPRRRLLNAIFYVVRSGCVWRLLPRDLPPGRRFSITSASGAWMAPGSGCTRRYAKRSVSTWAVIPNRAPESLTVNR